MCGVSMVVATLSVFAALALASDFARCEQMLREQPLERACAECFWKAAGTEHRTNALQRLQRAQELHPDSGWLTFYLAELHLGEQRDEAFGLYQASVKKFERLSDQVGVAEARLRITDILFELNRDESWREAARAVGAARASGDALLIARALLKEGELVQRTGERLGRGLLLLHEAHDLLFPNGPYALQRRVIGGLGKMSYDLGRYDEARSYYDQLKELARVNRDDQIAVIAAYNSLNARRKQMEELPEPTRLPEFTVAAKELVALADGTRQHSHQSMAYRTLGDLLWPVASTRADAEAHYRTALRHARQSQDPPELTSALWALGRVLAETQPVESRRLIDEALARAVDSGSATTSAYAWREQMRLAWKTLPREQASRESLKALDAIEALRRLQGPGEARAAVLGAWTPDYHWLIGALLESANARRADVALAFSVAERMRARLLLDALMREPQRGSADLAAASARQRLLGEISMIQRQLLDPRMQAATRKTAEARLERLEREEESLRGEFEQSGGVSAAEVMGVASLDQIERALGADEAILSFSIGVGRNFYGEFAGGAWLLVTTTSGTRVIGLPDRPALYGVLSVFQGLSDRSSTESAFASSKLYEMILGAAVRSLPPTVRRLIIVPDGPLHHLSFAALFPTPASAPLGATHEIVVAPSASVWLRLRQGREQSVPAAALVIADPSLPSGFDAAAIAQERDWPSSMVQIGRLPYSRAEGRAVVSHLAGESRLLTDAAATEAAVKSARLDRFGVVHFAPHAFVDDGRPARSALVLASDTATDDGLLQAREIADLPLRGRIVVLSACRSATGAVLAGEGVMGLSRSFFEAGARVVVGALWAVRDDHAAMFFDRFYERLSRGRSVGAAMHETRQDAIERGMPMSTWSSFVVIGDDSVVVSPSSKDARGAWSPLLLAVMSAILLAAMVALMLWRMRRRA